MRVGLKLARCKKNWANYQDVRKIIGSEIQTIKENVKQKIQVIKERAIQEV